MKAMTRPFKSEPVIDERISEATLRAYNVGFDQNKFRLQPLLDIVMDVVPEFAFGYYEAKNIPYTAIVNKLREAAKTIYTTDKYKRRGEFGEIVLHLLLRDFCNTTPLVSKIYFKDTNNVAVHGFDGVHISVEDNVKKLWLGESKFYGNGMEGINALLKDVKEHFEEDYLRAEFNLISRRIHNETPESEYWKQLMHRHKRLDEIFQSVCIPLVCTYTSDIFKSYTDQTKEYLEAFEKECRGLKAEFDKKNIHTNLEIILMLLPVPNKDELNTEFHKRLSSAQNI
ncbi:MAG: DUF1837 domain-containing protein [Candidatus Paceibacterota bacterium]